MSTRPKTFAETFLEFFDIDFVTTQSQKDNVGRIRFHVYCEEFHYEAGEEFPDGIEHDAFDAQSLHCLVTHKATNKPAGCVRLVRPTEQGDDGLPFEKFCSDSLDAKFFDNNLMPRESVCEISRLAVDGIFRRRPGERANRFGDPQVVNLSQHEQRTFPLIAVTCFLAATAMAELAGRTNAFAMMEPFLPRLLSRSGINFTKVGQDIDYHGLRAPYYARYDSTMETMVPEIKELYDTIHRMVKRDFEPD